MSDTIATESKDTSPKLQKDLFVFVTEFEGKLGIHCSSVIATDFDEAQKICDKRGFGEKPVERGEKFDIENATSFKIKWIKAVVENQCNAYMDNLGFPTVPNPMFPQTIP